MVIRSRVLRCLVFVPLLASLMVGCKTAKKTAAFPVVWEDDERDARTHHDESHQDVLPMLAGPVVEPSLSDFTRQGRWGIGIAFAPHAEEDIVLTGGGDEYIESSVSAEVFGLNMGWMAYEDFEIRIGFDQTSILTDGTSYQNIPITPGTIDSSDLSIGFRHYVPTYRVRPYFGMDYVIRSWDSVHGSDPLPLGTGDTVSVQMDSQPVLAFEAGIRYLWNANASVQLGLRWMDPLESGEGLATHRTAGGTIITDNDDLRINHDSMRLLFGVNWMF